MTHKRFVAWLCAIALALVALGAPLHALAHATQAASASSSVERDPAAAALTHACEQCLQFAALDGGVAAAVPALPCAAVAHAPSPAPLAGLARGVEFQAYAARAPPALG